ncbi:hypothetical protein NDU88_000041 [Pleurodeles waltl]|uniref:Uncharacterized protein n=1 Tax=Pleurodeles waltl TaxID=8319 RepID=A0AAV7TEA8_PLEWA|nr:hypothetical protein NDU88_000041 [Pleurodeles waltl]
MQWTETRPMSGPPLKEERVREAARQRCIRSRQRVLDCGRVVVEPGGGQGKIQITNFVREDAMEGEKDGLSLQEGDVCEVFCNVSEIMYGAITEQEWEEALKEDVELSEICVALEDGKFSTLENSACYLRGDRRERVVLRKRNRVRREFDG